MLSPVGHEQRYYVTFRPKQLREGDLPQTVVSQLQVEFQCAGKQTVTTDLCGTASQVLYYWTKA